METQLSEKKCQPCRGDVPPLAGPQLDELAENLDNAWDVVDGHHLHKQYTFDDFRQALDFTNRIGEIAEQQGHHPMIHLTYGKVEVDIHTHEIDGLTESDFILAAKFDAA